jgi:hypothetical protein
MLKYLSHFWKSQQQCHQGNRQPSFIILYKITWEKHRMPTQGSGRGIGCHHGFVTICYVITNDGFVLIKFEHSSGRTDVSKRDQIPGAPSHTSPGKPHLLWHWGVSGVKKRWAFVHHADTDAMRRQVFAKGGLRVFCKMLCHGQHWKFPDK